MRKWSHDKQDAETFNEPNPAPFVARLREAGFYAEWKGTYGDEAWAILESAVGRTLA